MRGSINAREIDEDYRKEQMYKNKKRNRCKERSCEECKAFEVCTEVERKDEI